MKKVLLIGEYYSTNLGDPVLCQTVKNHIEVKYPDVEVIPYDMSGKIGYAEHFELNRYSEGFKFFLRVSTRMPAVFRQFAVYRAYKKDEGRYISALSHLNDLLQKNKFDLAVFAGGSIFMDYFAGVIYCIVRRLKQKKIPVVFHACGLGTLDADSTLLIDRTINLPNVKTISLRDSLEKFRELFCTSKNILSTYDTALACNSYFSPSKKKCAEYGVGVIDLPQYYEFQKELVRHFIQSDKSWRLFTNGSFGDADTAKQILSELGIAEELYCNYILDRPSTAEELVKTITSFNKIISFRMHSLVIAQAYGIPNYGFVWSQKIAEFYQKLGAYDGFESPCGDVCLDTIVQKLVAVDSKMVFCAGEESRNCLYQELESLNVLG